MRNKYIDLLELNGCDTSNVTIHGNIEDDIKGISLTRRPVYAVRGEPLSENQVIELVTNEEPLFSKWRQGEIRNKRQGDPRETTGVLKNIFYRRGYSWLSSWLYTDGTIGGEMLETHYPKFNEWAVEWVNCAKRNPFLNIVVGYTSIDEHLCTTCKYGINNVDCGNDDFKIGSNPVCDECNHKFCSEMQKYFKSIYKKTECTLDTLVEYQYLHWFGLVHSPLSISKFVRIAIVIKDGKVDFYSGVNAREVYEDYNRKYSFKGCSLLFTGAVLNSRFTCICDSRFIKKCFEHIGLSEAEYDKAISQELIKVYDNNLVVTKNWVIEQYSKMLNKLNVAV